MNIRVKDVGSGLIVSMQLSLDTLISEVKGTLKNKVHGRPEPTSQIILLNGRALDDNVSLKEALGKVCVIRYLFKPSCNQFTILVPRIVWKLSRSP